MSSKIVWNVTQSKGPESARRHGYDSGSTLHIVHQKSVSPVHCRKKVVSKNVGCKNVVSRNIVSKKCHTQKHCKQNIISKIIVSKIVASRIVTSRNVVISSGFRDHPETLHAAEGSGLWP